jgi:hypothetical protein
MSEEPKLKIYFSEYFGVDAAVVEQHGSFNVSLVNDLPLFIDPFLLFNSPKAIYRELHEGIIRYLRFLREKAVRGGIGSGLLEAWFTFPEVKQTWLGFSKSGNGGSGLGPKFARSMSANLATLFPDFGREAVTKASHLEKLCLIEDGVGRDNISDFTTNLIKGFLLSYTQDFAQRNLADEQRRRVNIDKATFNFDTESWENATFELPHIGGDYVILTPRDLLTKDDTWINRDDLLGNIDEIANAVSDAELRAKVSNYIAMRLAHGPEDDEPTEKERREAAVSAVLEFPALIDHYIRWKEDNGEKAAAISRQKVAETEQIFIRNVQRFASVLATTGFYELGTDTLDEARQRVGYLKHVIENQDGYRLFHGAKNKPIRRESDLQLFYLLTWFATMSDVNREPNNGRGPVDFKISRGVADKSLVEFKLARNSKLERNLAHQVEIYQRANQTNKALKVIVYFTEDELTKVQAILRRLKLTEDPNVILIDARSDNKPSASIAVQ